MEISKYDRLLEAKKILGFTNADIAKLLEMTEGGVRHALRNKTIKDLYFIAICSEYSISRDWMLYGKGSMQYDNVEFDSVDPDVLLQQLEEIEDKHPNVKLRLLKADLLAFIHHFTDLKNQNAWLRQLVGRYRGMVESKK